MIYCIQAMVFSPPSHAHTGKQYGLYQSLARLLLSINWWAGKLHCHSTLPYPLSPQQNNIISIALTSQIGKKHLSVDDQQQDMWHIVGKARNTYTYLDRFCLHCKWQPFWVNLDHLSFAVPIQFKRIGWEWLCVALEWEQYWNCSML